MPQLLSPRRRRPRRSKRRRCSNPYGGAMKKGARGAPFFRLETTMNQFATRTERDTFGPIEVPADRLWGAQTQRSLQNFKIAGDRMPSGLIRALAQVKRAAVQVNMDLGALAREKGAAIIAAADEVIAGTHEAEFPLVIWQTGS